MKSLEDIRKAAHQAIEELVEAAKLQAGEIIVIGCSTSEIKGSKIGSDSSMDIAQVLWDEFKAAADRGNFELAFQCCEHLNRALVVDRSTVTNQTIVNVVPWEHAGGSMATTAYKNFDDPVVVEFIQADAGLDIGDTFIGMHLKHVCVPVRISVKEIGQAHLTAARVRPKSIGGPRAHYDESLL